MPEQFRAPGLSQSGVDGPEGWEENPETGAPDDLALQTDALRSVLERLLDEMSDIDHLAVHVPRLTNASSQVSRTRHHTGGPANLGLLALLTPTLEEMDRLQATITDR